MTEEQRIKHRLWKRTFMGYYSEAYLRIKYRIQYGPKRYRGLPVMSRKEFDAFLAETIKIRKSLYQKWVKKNKPRRLAPSIDRLDPSKGYVVGNCRWLPQWENSSLGGKNSQALWRLAHLTAPSEK